MLPGSVPQHSNGCHKVVNGRRWRLAARLARKMPLMIAEVVMRVSYEDSIKGRTVIDASGAGIGEVVGLYVELDEGGRGAAIAGIGVKLRSEVADAIGLPRGTFHAVVVHVPAAAVQAIGDAVLLNAAIGSLVHRPAAEAPSAP